MLYLNYKKNLKYNSLWDIIQLYWHTKFDIETPKECQNAPQKP